MRSKLAREMPRRAASGHMPLDAVLEVGGGGQDRIRLHQRMAGRAGLPAPVLARVRRAREPVVAPAAERKAVILRDAPRPDAIASGTTPV